MDVTTPILAKWKEKWPEYFLTGLAGLLALLLTTIWLEVGATIWGRISAAISNKALLALLGLSTIAICLLGAYVFHQRRAAKHLQTQIGNLENEIQGLKNPTHVPLPYQFGARWTPEHEPRCPYCEGILINYISALVVEKWLSWIVLAVAPYTT